MIEGVTVPDITFSIEQQEHDQWCWAAVALSLCNFYGDDSWPEQCDLVNDIFAPIRGSTDCCQDGDTLPCNMSWSLSIVLNTVHHLALPIRGVVTFDDLTQEIEVGQRPVAARFMFSDLLTAHFIVLVGCAKTPDGKQWVKVADPSLATGNITSIEYSTLLSDYRPGATWNESYFTA
jgi:hypothetical protein